MKRIDAGHEAREHPDGDREDDGEHEDEPRKEAAHFRVEALAGVHEQVTHAVERVVADRNGEAEQDKLAPDRADQARQRLVIIRADGGGEKPGDDQKNPDVIANPGDPVKDRGGHREMPFPDRRMRRHWPRVCPVGHGVDFPFRPGATLIAPYPVLDPVLALSTRREAALWPWAERSY